MPALPVYQPDTAPRTYLHTLLKAEKAALAANFDVAAWVTHRTRQTDAILRSLYAQHFPDQAVTLFALGGYGRGELFPRSDIDLLILHDAAPANPLLNSRIESFVQDLWQLGLDIAQQVSDAVTCLANAREDIDSLTSLLEARFIAGDEHQLSALKVNDPPLIPPLDFIAAKLREQRDRDHRQEHMGRLEPNIKIAPGGLRDIHMIDWVLHYCHAPAFHSTLTPAEHQELLDNRDTLWRIRYALHLLGGSDKDRLLFERQKRLAALFAWQDSATSSATEQFMRHYYQTTRRIRRISRLIVKLVEAQHLPPAAIDNLDEHYCIRAGRIDLINPHPDFFRRHPEQLWPLFAHLQNHPQLDGLHPLLARNLYEARDHLVTHTFRMDKTQRQGFLALLDHPGDVHRQVRRMLRYGILYRYIPGFWHIVGRMQYDLFHQYTVDQHTLRVIAILDSFKAESPRYPHAHDIMRALERRAVLYLAAIFHDIGKGYQGDHCDIGAAMAESFALENDALSNPDSQRLIFLVKHHLLMSHTAQKKDLTDPSVIRAFAHTVGNRANLDHLYLLTLADISATNEQLWNSWRATLLASLYRLTLAELEHKSALPAHLERRKNKARPLLDDIADLDTLWNNLPDAFFLGESRANIAAKTRELANIRAPHHALALSGSPPQLYIRSSHSPDIVFARVTHFLEQHSQSIMEARLYQSHDKRHTLQQYTLADSAQPLAELIAPLIAQLDSDQPPPPLKKRLPAARLRHFPIPTRIELKNDPGQQRSILELTCQDRHGLLSTVSRILLAHNLHVDHAKISTLGERVEDIFYLTNADGEIITDPAQLDNLRTALHNALDNNP